MSGCWFPYAKYLIATQQLDLETVPLQAILLGENSTILASLTAQVITDIATLDEFNGLFYVRNAPTGGTWVETPGVDVRFETNNIAFGSLNSGSSRLAWTLIATDAGGDGTSIPVFFFGRALGPVHPAGGDVNITDISAEF